MLDRSRSRDRSKTGGAFSPAGLFVTGAQGAWYDPSDFSTLFQNNAGNVPVTAVEQPVRLMLDRSRGLVLGPELVPSAPSVSAFNANGTAVVAGNVITCTCTTNGTYGFSITSVAPAINKSYRLVVTTVTNSASRSLFADFGGLTRSFGSLAGTAERIYTATTSTGSLVVYILGGVAGETFSVNLATLSVRELPGNHALAPNDASRPVLRARYNLLLRSETMITNPWFSGPGYNSTITNGTIIAPDGATTGSTLASDTGGGTGTCILAWASTLVANTPYTFSFFVRANTLSWIRLFVLNHGNNGGAFFDVANGALGTIDAGFSATITAAANQYYRCSITFTPTLTGPGELRLVLANSDGNTSVARDGTKSVYVWGAQLLTAADQTATGGAYQRIAAATDYDTSNPVWRPYLAFDGSDDSFGTSAIDFSGTDEMTVFAGVHKASDAARGMLVELSATFANSGAFAVVAPNSAAANYAFLLTGNVGEVNYLPTTYAAPITNVLSCVYDFAGALRADELKPRIDGVLTQTSGSGTEAGTNTGFLNAALFIGRRNNTNLPFNGRLYSLAVLGRTATAAELGAMEAWVAGKTGVNLP